MKKSMLNPKFKFGKKKFGYDDTLSKLVPIKPWIKLNIDYGEKMIGGIDEPAGFNFNFIYQNYEQINAMRDFMHEFIHARSAHYDKDYNVFYQPNGLVSRLRVRKEKLFHKFMKRFIEIDGMIAKVDNLTIQDEYDEATQKLVASKIDAMKKLYQQNCAQNNALTTSIMYR